MMHGKGDPLLFAAQVLFYYGLVPGFWRPSRPAPSAGATIPTCEAPAGSATLGIAAAAAAARRRPTTTPRVRPLRAPPPKARPAAARRGPALPTPRARLLPAQPPQALPAPARLSPAPPTPPARRLPSPLLEVIPVKAPRCATRGLPLCPCTGFRPSDRCRTRPPPPTTPATPAATGTAAPARRSPPAGAPTPPGPPTLRLTGSRPRRGGVSTAARRLPQQSQHRLQHRFQPQRQLHKNF